MKYEEIRTVKEQENGYLVNDSIHVPKIDENTQYQLLKMWLHSNESEPLLTDKQILENAMKDKIEECKNYLISTDFKMTIDYYDTLTTDEKIELVDKRAEVRQFIKENEV